MIARKICPSLFSFSQQIVNYLVLNQCIDIIQWLQRDNCTPTSLKQRAGIAENCHLKSPILPNFATKIWKFCHKTGKFATFGRKNCQILRIKFTNRITFFRPRRSGILHWSKDAHKKSLRCISERKMIKKINLISKQEYENLQRETSKFNDTRFSKKWNCYNTRTPKSLSFLRWAF